MSVDRKPLKSKANKWLIFLMAAFFAIQIVVDGCHSLTAFPFAHYGMFSESFSNPDSLTGFEIVVDAKRLDAADFGIYRWDMIQQPLTAFERQTRTGDFAFDRSRIKAAFPGLYSRFASNFENPPTLPANFPAWYHSYLLRLMHKPFHSFQVFRCQYRFVHNQLLPTQKVLWLSR